MIPTDSSAHTPPTESVNDPSIYATELMDDTDTPPDEDDMLEQRLEEGGVAEAEAEHTDGNVGIVTTREPIVIEHIADETLNFLEMDEDLEEEVEDDEEVEVGEREMLRGLNLIIR